MNHEIEDIVRQLPRPRGEGFWAWVRYNLLSFESRFNGSGKCRVVGCPHQVVASGYPLCRRHFYEHREQENEKSLAQHAKYLADLAEYDRRRAAGLPGCITRDPSPPDSRPGGNEPN